MDYCADNGIQQLALLQYEGASITPKTKEPTFDNPIPNGLVSSLLVFYMELLINRIVKIFNYRIDKDIFILIVALVVVRYSNNIVNEIYNFSYNFTIIIGTRYRKFCLQFYAQLYLWQCIKQRFASRSRYFERRTRCKIVSTYSHAEL